jgi:hypothetical protein
MHLSVVRLKLPRPHTASVAAAYRPSVEYVQCTRLSSRSPRSFAAGVRALAFEIPSILSHFLPSHFSDSCDWLRIPDDCADCPRVSALLGKLLHPSSRLSSVRQSRTQLHTHAASQQPASVMPGQIRCVNLRGENFVSGCCLRNYFAVVID